MLSICSHDANSGSELRLKNLSRKIDSKGVNFSVFFQQSNRELRVINGDKQKINQNISPKTMHIFFSF